MGAFIDLTGQKFGKLTVLSRSENHIKRDGSTLVTWKCICDCGNITNVTRSDLKSGKTKSCGCLPREINAERLTKHGDYKTRLYRIWSKMKSRCQNSSDSVYKYYGGKGIKICDEWASYTNFKSWSLNHGYSEELTIDRIDSNGNYEPNNCRWVTQKVQNNNTKKNVYYEFNGESHTVAEWSDIFNIKYGTLLYRLSAGWPIEKALSKPTKKK